MWRNDPLKMMYLELKTLLYRLRFVPVVLPFQIVFSISFCFYPSMSTLLIVLTNGTY